MLKTDVAKLLLDKYGKNNPPVLKAGDTVKVHQKIKEGDKERVQVFEGLVIALKHGRGLDGSFTVRKIAVGGIGVERVYPLHSPNIVKIERVKTAEVKRAKLYYMRDRRGKNARFKVEVANPGSWVEKDVVIPEAVETPAEIVAEEQNAESELAPETEEAVVEAVVEEAAAQEEGETLEGTEPEVAESEVTPEEAEIEVAEEEATEPEETESEVTEPEVAEDAEESETAQEKSEASEEETA